MAEQTTLYMGVNKAGKLRKRALEAEVRRCGPGASMSAIIWDALKKAGSAALKADLEAADQAEAK